MSVTATCDVSPADRALALCAGLAPETADTFAQTIIARLEAQTSVSHALAEARTIYDGARARWLRTGAPDAVVTMVLAMTETYPDLDNIAREPWPGSDTREVVKLTLGGRWHVRYWRALCWFGADRRCSCRECTSAGVKMRSERRSESAARERARHVFPDGSRWGE